MKILVSDFDLTFFDNDFINNIKLVNEWTSKGNIFVIATGRSLHSLKKIIDNYNITIDFYICNDGAAIYDKKQQEIYRKDIDSKTSQTIFEYIKSSNVFSQVLIDTGEMVTDIPTARCNCLLGIIDSREEAKKVLGDILNKFSNVTGYLSKNCLNINDITVNKANGIKTLMSKNNWDKNNIYTVGDDINDIEMLQEFNGFLIDYKSMNFNLKKVNSFKEAFGLLNESN